jgi:hypothetical protein
MSNKIRITKFCRLCKSKKLYNFLKLGKIPVTNELNSNDNKTKYPNLNILVCCNCWHVQSGSVPNSSKFYKDKYTYHTRFIKTIDEHFYKNAKIISKKYSLKKDDLVIDIGGNDGTYLKHFKNLNKKIKTLCVEPTIETSNFAKKIGINVFQDFFNLKNSQKIKKKYGLPKIILCTNSYGNIDNILNFTKGLDELIGEDTVFIFENPYLVSTLKNNQFDTMYYEHVSYFSITPLVKFFSKFNLEIFDYKKTKVHGGSIMIYVRRKKNNKINKKILSIIKNEKKFGLSNIMTYKKFSKNIKKIKNSLNVLLNQLSKNNKSIIAYGASDRGMVLLNYCKIGKKNINFVVDRNPFKHNYFYSGTGLKIYNVEKLIKEKPDYVFLTAWNFHSEIIKYLNKKIKTKYIIPLPAVKIIE